MTPCTHSPTRTHTHTHAVTANTHANQRPQHKRVALTRFIFMVSERQNQCQCALCRDLCAIKIDKGRPTKPTDEIGPNDYERQQQAQVSNMLPFLAESTNETLAAVVQLQLHRQHTHTETLANRCTDVRKAKPQNWITIMFICFCIGTATFDIMQRTGKGKKRRRPLQECNYSLSRVNLPLEQSPRLPKRNPDETRPCCI